MAWTPWWFAAIPILFALGWFAARVDIRQIVRESRVLPHTYFKGLNHLLNDESNKAVECFLEAAKLDPETIELHFALGSLLRRRGESFRAIRIHQNLIQRDGLTSEQRGHARLELGQDFLKAGLLDRAEEVFLGVLSTEKNPRASVFLKEIYVTGREWEKAIDITRKMEGEDADGEGMYMAELSHFYCELADQKILLSDWQAAKTYLIQAQEVNKNSVRAAILLGDVYAALNDDEQALSVWQTVEKINPQYLSMIIERLAGAYKRLGREAAGMNLLRRYLERHPNVFELLPPIVADDIAQGKRDEAMMRLRKQLQNNPSLSVMERLLSVKMTHSDEEDLRLLHSLMLSLQRNISYHGCQSCGFTMKQFMWCCPACSQWETFTVRQENPGVAGASSSM